MEKILTTFIAVFVFVVAFVFFIYIPYDSHIHAKCLEAGYDKAHTTLSFKGYCSKLPGTIVEEVKELK